MDVFRISLEVSLFCSYISRQCNVSFFLLIGVLEHHKCWRYQQCGKCSKTSSKSYLASTGWLFWIHVSKSLVISFSSLSTVVGRSIISWLCGMTDMHSRQISASQTWEWYVDVGVDNSGRKFKYIFSWISPASQSATRIEFTAKKWMRSSQIAAKKKELMRKPPGIVADWELSTVLPVPEKSLMMMLLRLNMKCPAVLT